MPRISVNREHLIQLLEFVQPGLSQREIIEQSSCYVFRPNPIKEGTGLILTFNDEIACSVESPFDFQGAVQASPLLTLLHKMTEDTVDLENGDAELRVYGKSRRAGIRMEAEVTLPVEKVERPKKWKPLPDGFIEAVKMTCQCVGKDESKFVATCVHLTPKWIEASDSYQITRYRISTDLSAESVMVRGQSIKQAMDVGVTHFCETPNWIHFRNDSKLVLSCRRHLEEYIDLSPFLKVEGTEPLVLPKGLTEACEKAGIFSVDNAAGEDLVTVRLKKNKLVVKGEGVLGWFRETKKVTYKGRELSFMVSPLILSEIVKRMSECEISEEKLKVKGDKWVYVSCLSQEKDEDEDEENNETPEE